MLSPLKFKCFRPLVINVKKPSKVYDLIADRWNEKHYKARSWTRYFRKFIAKKGFLLDAGCGNAINSISLAPLTKKIYAIDLSRQMVSHAKSNVSKSNLSRKISVRQGDVLKLPFKDSFFDYAACFAVLHHFLDEKEWEKAFGELNRVLKKGGLAFITIKNINHANRGSKGKVVKLNFSDDKAPDKSRVYYLIEKKALLLMVKKHGFKVKSFFYEKKGFLTNQKSGFNSCLVLEKILP